MPIDREIKCINKTPRFDPHDRIQNVGGVVNGVRWKEGETIAIRQIDARTHTYWTMGGGRRAKVEVAVREGKRYLKTENDGVTPNNLLALPECP